jgi:hypothetical protein
MTENFETAICVSLLKYCPSEFCNIEPMRILALLLLTFLTSAAWTQTPSRKKPATASASQSCGPISNDTFNCPQFRFTYKIPYGWVDRTDEMQDEPESPQPANAKSDTLLAIFERPPAAPGETINSAVVIASEPLTAYQGLKTAADYFGPISELAEQRGFKVVEEPHEVSIGAKRLVRGDFNKDRGKLTMWQSSLVMIEKGSILSLTFVAGSEDEIDELIEHLHFASTASPAQSHSERK